MKLCDRVKEDHVCLEPVEWMVYRSHDDYEVVCGDCLLDVLDHNRDQLVRRARADILEVA